MSHPKPCDILLCFNFNKYFLSSILIYFYLYYFRLKAVEIVLNSNDSVNETLSHHEQTLLAQDTLPSDREALRSLQYQLKVYNQYNIYHSLLYLT